MCKVMNCLMYDGKKSMAESIVYGALDRVRERGGNDPVRVSHEALDNVKPEIEVRSRRVGGATYQVPVEVRNERGQAIAIRWLIGASRPRPEIPMTERPAGALLDASNNRGSAVRS